MKESSSSSSSSREEKKKKKKQLKFVAKIFFPVWALKPKIHVLKPCLMHWDPVNLNALFAGGDPVSHFVPCIGLDFTAPHHHPRPHPHHGLFSFQKEKRACEPWRPQNSCLRNCVWVTLLNSIQNTHYNFGTRNLSLSPLSLSHFGSWKPMSIVKLVMDKRQQSFRL